MNDSAQYVSTNQKWTAAILNVHSGMALKMGGEGKSSPLSRASLGALNSLCVKGKWPRERLCRLMDMDMWLTVWSRV